MRFRPTTTLSSLQQQTSTIHEQHALGKQGPRLRMCDTQFLGNAESGAGEDAACVSPPCNAHGHEMKSRLSLESFYFFRRLVLAHMEPQLGNILETKPEARLLGANSNVIGWLVEYADGSRHRKQA